MTRVMVGQSIAHYQVDRRLGSGGMGEVFLARDTRLDRPVALKFLPQEYLKDEKRRQRFVSEARAASALNHPHVCVIYEVTETPEGRPFIVMEYIQGATLHAMVQRGVVDIPLVVEIGLQTADALDAAHDLGLIHRDIKPANISLNERGKVKILDFGLAKRQALEAGPDPEAPTQAETKAGEVLGTPHYMSPEQALGRQVDHRSDLFSLGVVLYELAAGRRPFSGQAFGEVANNIINHRPERLTKFRDQVPPELERIIFKCLEKNLEYRYPSAKDLLADLKKLKRSLEESGRWEREVEPAEKASSAEPSEPSLKVPEESDLYISYAHVDDQPLMHEKEGWISQFHRDLEIRVQQLSGEPVKIWRQSHTTGTTDPDPKVLQVLPGIKAMISVVSPPFVKSPACRTEVTTFWESTGHERQEPQELPSRILKVVKRPVDEREMPEDISDVFKKLNGFEFFEQDPETGRFWEYDESFGPQAKLRYYERVYDVAQEVSKVLRAMKESQSAREETSAGLKKVIYLAEASSDLKTDRDRLKRELTERGHTVLPDEPLPWVDKELRNAVRESVGKADFSIHLVGGHYGLIPEDGRRSISEIQWEIAREISEEKKLSRIVWIPSPLEIEDDRQETFLQEIKNHSERPAVLEIIQEIYHNFKSVLLEKISKPPPSASKVTTDSEERDRIPQVYLICDSADEEAVEPLEDYLFDQGLNVVLPDFEAKEEEFHRVHMQNLRESDAVVVYYGTTRKAWVEIKLREMAKAAGYGNARALRAKAVVVAPPHDRRKERFRWHDVDIVKQEENFEPPLLDGFVKKVRS